MRFPAIDSGEDTDYQTRLRPLLKSDVFVDRFLYDYLHLSPIEKMKERNAIARLRGR